MADAVAGVLVAVVARIVDKVQPIFPAKLLNLLAGTPNQRTDNLPAHRRDTAQTVESGPSCQIEQDGFRVVIEVVRGSNPALLPCQCGQQLIPALSGKGFHRLSCLLCLLLCPDAVNRQRNVIPSAKIGAELLVSLRFLAAQTVVDVAGLHPNVQLLLQPMQSKQQRCGIRSAGKSDHYPLLRL